MHCYILDMITYQRELIIFLHVFLRGGNMFHVCMNFTKALLSDQLLYIVDDKKKECMNHDWWCKSLIPWWIILQTSNISLKLTILEASIILYRYLVVRYSNWFIVWHVTYFHSTPCTAWNVFPIQSFKW